MKRNIACLTLIFVFSIFYSCDKNKNDETLLGKWKVEKLYKDSLMLPQIDNEYIFEFVDDTTVNVKLDVNSCYGKYNMSCNDCIDFQGFGCTEACCDTKYALGIINIANETTYFSIDGDQLILKGSGEITLKKL